jgi:hypothetical protein
MADPEISRFPRKGRPYMPGSQTTPGPAGARINAPASFAFREVNNVGTRIPNAFAAQWLAYTLPYRRFAVVLAGNCARIGDDVGCYSFIAVDFHRIPLAGLPAHSLALRPAHSRGHQFVARYTEGFSHFVTSMTASVASGWSESPGEPFTHWNAPPFTAHTHSGHSHRSFALRKFLKTLGSPRGASWRQICTLPSGHSSASTSRAPPIQRWNCCPFGPSNSVTRLALAARSSAMIGAGSSKEGHGSPRLGRTGGYGGIGLVSTVKRDLLDGGHAAAQFLRFASRPTGGRP